MDTCEHLINAMDSIPDKPYLVCTNKILDILLGGFLDIMKASIQNNILF